MRTGNKPSNPRCPLGAIQPLPVDTEAIKAAAWHDQSILIVSIDHPKLDWTDRQFIETIARRLYGA